MAPPRCPACSAQRSLAGGGGICSSCRAALAASPPRRIPLDPRIGFAVVSAVPYVAPATGLVAALKSGRVPSAAGIAAELIAEALGPLPPEAVLVPVGAAPTRRLRRGLDPAEEIALALAGRLGLGCQPRLLARRGGRSQRGRSRAARLAAPPRFEVRGTAAASVLIVDDVVTTGATLSACAKALRRSGADPAGAVSFAWTPAPEFA